MRINRELKRHKLSLTISILSALSTGALQAQTSDTSSNDAKLESLVVTGTRREGVSPLETLSPIDMLGGDQLANQASFDVTDSLTRITPSINTQRFPIADGTSFIRPVTLRNLSPDQTLVLVNGTRRHRSALVNLQLAPLGTANQGSQGVDFSTIPSAAIQRVEVLRDGASAQYGSDAIAGVVNIILKDADHGLNISSQYGSYYEGDGDRFSLSLNGGLPLGNQGFINGTIEHATTDTTSRGNARPDAVQVASVVGNDLVPFNGLGQRWGDPEVETTKIFINSELPLSDHASLYANASYMDNTTTSGFFYRGPILDPSEEFAARETLQVDTDGDFLPDNAPQDLIDAITADNLNPANYLVADSDSPSGYVLRNPIYTLFPGGYNPTFGADLSDYSIVFGGRGEAENFTWDLRARLAENKVEYTISDTINPSLGILSPTQFSPGTLIQEESSLNGDFTKSIENDVFASDINIGFGFELRNETYEIQAGNPDSISAGPTAAIFGVGSDGFQGFTEDAAGSFKSDSMGLYIDVEADTTEKLTLGSAFRWEDFDEFGSTLDGKLSARFAFTHRFALRSTVSTGFRAPTPGQVNTLNVTTTSDSSGNLIPNGTYPVNNPISLALGSQPLTPEESQSFTIGSVFNIFSNTSITLDYYVIDIDDRLALQNNPIGADEVTLLANAGIDSPDLLLGSNANFFVNAFDSKVSGVDLVVLSDFSMPVGVLTVDWRHSYNKQEVKSVTENTINQSRVFDLENQVPNHRSVLTFNYTNGDSFNSYIRFNHYGGWESTGGLFGPGDASDVSSYGSSTLVDIEARFTFAQKYTLAIGGDNIFDVLPGKEQNETLRFLGVESSITSPYGFNGGFWYVRASASI